MHSTHDIKSRGCPIGSWKVQIVTLLHPDLLGNAGQRHTASTPTLPPLSGGASQGSLTFQRVAGSMTCIRTIRSPGKTPSMEFKNRLKLEHSIPSEKAGLWSFAPQRHRPALRSGLSGFLGICDPLQILSIHSTLG